MSRLFLTWGFLCAFEILARSEEEIDLQIITVESAEQVEKILSRLEAGESFSRLAAEFSTHVTASRGGFLGRMPLSVLKEDLRRHAEALEVGVPSHFLDPQLGHTILRRLDPRTADRAYALQAIQEGAADLERHRFDAAIQQFKRAISLDPTWAEAHLRLGHAYRMTGNYKLIGEAKGEFRQALLLDPFHVSARLLLSSTYLDLGLSGKAREVLEEKPEVTDQSFQLLSLLGELDRRDGHPQLSVGRNRKALEMEPSSTTTQYNLARAYLDLGETEKASELLTRIVAARDATSDMLITAGSFLLDRNEANQAVPVIERALSLAPSLPEAHLELGRAYRMQGRPEAALEQLDLALHYGGTFSASPEYRAFELGVYFERGRAFEISGDLPEAVAAYSRVLALDPEHGKTHEGLARVWIQQGEYERALRHASEARRLGVALEPDLLAKLEESTGDRSNRVRPDGSID